MYIADYSNHRIRKVTISTGLVSTIAGTGTNSYSGDGGEATSAALNYPQGVALDSSGSFLFLYQQFYTNFSRLLILFRECLYR